MATPLLAVIKADAYGHGAVEVAHALEEDVAGFAVASVDEGQTLRAAGVTLPILLLSAILPGQAAAVVEAELTATVSTREIACALDEAARSQRKRALAHWKVDTGMSRFGTWHEDARHLWKALQEFTQLEVNGVYTHFARADEPEQAWTLKQIEAFESTLAECGISDATHCIHAANSAGALRYPQAHYGAVRTGIALYGASPFGLRQRSPSLRPVMSLKARITDVRRVAVGRAVSYGATWVARRDSVLALVPLGYADGYPRCLSNSGEVLVRGRRCRVAGRVTMDQLLVDVTEVAPNAQAGEIVTAWGVDESGVLLPVEEVAEKANTIAYEMLTGVAGRVPRLHIREEVVGKKKFGPRND